MKRSLAIVAAVLGLAWLGATGVLLFFVAGLASLTWFLLAFVAMDAAFLLSVALLIETNTRRAWSAARDPYGHTTDELLRNPVMLPDDRPYGRRAHDDRNVVARLSDILEEEADRRKPGETPAWVVDVNRAHAAASDMFPDLPKEETE
jgi:hypothetical protein